MLDDSDPTFHHHRVVSPPAADRPYCEFLNKVAAWRMVNTTSPFLICTAPKTGCFMWKNLITFVNMGDVLTDALSATELASNPGLVRSGEESPTIRCYWSHFESHSESRHYHSKPFCTFCVILERLSGPQRDCPWKEGFKYHFLPINYLVRLGSTGDTTTSMITSIQFRRSGHLGAEARGDECQCVVWDSVWAFSAGKGGQI